VSKLAPDMRNSENKKVPKKSPISITEMRTMMERAIRGFATQDRIDAEEKALDLAHDAMDEPSPKRRLSLLRDALSLDPENVDALLMMLDLSGVEGEQRIDALRAIVAAGAKRLGPQAFKDFVPHFWGVIETRPYMRARIALAEELRAAGRIQDAAVEYDEILKLNENDNQGVRYQLLICRLTLGQLTEAKALFDKYDEIDFNAAFAWGAVLERLLSADSTGAVDRLMRARKQNPYVEAYLKGHRRLPKNLPPYYSPGNRDEAIVFASGLIEAWEKHPSAMKWLREQKPRA
jgi:tetratricopeptide (TPR) repeat protein